MEMDKRIAGEWQTISARGKSTNLGALSSFMYNCLHPCTNLEGLCISIMDKKKKKEEEEERKKINKKVANKKRVYMKS